MNLRVFICKMQQLTKQTCRISKIPFLERKINDSHNIFKELEKFLDLVEVIILLFQLDLSGNEITRLPENMSNLANLQALDITNNPLENVTLSSFSLIKLALPQQVYPD